MNDIEKIHYIATNPLNCNIHHEEGDTLTVQRVKALAYVVRSQGQQLADTQRKLEAALSTEAQPEVTVAVAQNVSAAAEKYAETWTYVTAEESMISERKFQIETLGGYAERKRITGWVSFDDARRIVACVNACRGIETETLENIGRIVPAETHAKKNPVAKVVFDTSKDLDGNVTKSRPQIFKEMGDKQLMQFEPDTPLYPPSAIEGYAQELAKRLVKEKLEEAARICDVRSKGINCQQSLRDCAKRIRTLMESPHTSVEEPAN